MMNSQLFKPHSGPCSSTPSRAEMALYGVYEISRLLASPGPLNATLTGVLALLSSFLDMRNGLIALLDEAGEPRVVVGSGCDEAQARRHFQRLPEQVIGRMVVTRQPLVVKNIAFDPLFADLDFSSWGPEGRSYSFIGVPIRDRDKVIGTLTIDRDWDEVPHFYFDEDVRFLNMVASLVGQTVRLQQLIAQDRERLIAEQRRLTQVLEEGGGQAEVGSARSNLILGRSAAIQAVLEKVRIVARTQSSVLLRGESGTGKELFAQELHKASPRSNAPFVKLNCAALPESVLESELFGHEKGAFTGAVSQRKGRFELADGGTLFLDEIGEISPAFQAKLLRVLQEGEFERVGGCKTIKVDVRLVSATNRNLEEAVSQGKFREDLYYRISVVPIFLPPLRERRSDVPLLAREFLRRFNKENHTRLVLEEGALAVIAACNFPGNVRELENCIRHSATLVRGERIGVGDLACRNDSCLSFMLWKSAPSRTRTPTSPAPAAVPVPKSMPKEERASCPDPIEDGPAAPAERERLIAAMEMAGWVQAKAARLLGLTPRQMGYALRKQRIAIKKI